MGRKSRAKHEKRIKKKEARNLPEIPAVTEERRISVDRIGRRFLMSDGHTYILRYVTEAGADLTLGCLLLPGGGWHKQKCWYLPPWRLQMTDADGRSAWGTPQSSGGLPSSTEIVSRGKCWWSTCKSVIWNARRIFSSCKRRGNWNSMCCDGITQALQK